MTPMTNIFTKTEAIAAKNPPKPQLCMVVNACKSIIYKQTEAQKGRLDHNHGCNPWTKTLAQHGCKPCPTGRNPRAFLLLLLALVAIATTARAQVIVIHDNVKYVLYNNGTAYVDYSPGAWGTLNLRETVSSGGLTCTVTRISDGAFYHNYQITGNLVIPNTVTHIGEDAFRGCSGLNGTLTLPDGLLTIGSEAFYQCTGLTGTLNLPATLTSIGSQAFINCDGFSGTLSLPPLLTEIKDLTFYGIEFTGDLVVPDGVTTIGNYAFYRNKFSSITIGNGVTTIGHYAFSLTAADQLTLGSSVASIGDEAFRYYDEDITHNHILNIKCLNAVPATLGVDVFMNHHKWLVEVPCGARDAYIYSPGWLQYITETRIKVAKPMLGDFTGYVYYLLNPCDGTATVTHSGYTEADENNNSYWQAEVVIPSTVEHEGEIYRVTKIGARAFKGCSLVSSVYIGDYVESIGNDAFYGVKDLVYFTCHNPVPPALGVDVFYSSNPPYGHLYQLTVPCGSVEAYQNAWQWNSFKNFQSLNYRAKVEINGVYYVLNCDGTATVTHAGYSEDDSNSGSYSGYVVIPGTVTYKGETHVVNRIGNNAFKGCVSLTDAIIGENVETIGDNAFEGCTALTRGGSGGDLANIGNNAFKGCTALTYFTIGENVENIGNNAFDGCTVLSSITSERLEPPALGSDVFSGVPTSAVLNVPCTATEAYAAAAQWQDFNIQGVVAAYINAQIDGVYYVLNPCRGTATVTHAGYDEIANAHYMNSYPDAVAITIPETVTHEGATYDVTRIGAYAFLFSNSLTSIVIGEKVGYVGGDAFGGCSGLQSITSKNPTPPTLGWGGDVFQQVPTSAKLYVPCSAVETYAAAGGWNRFETISEIYYQIGNLYYSICGGTATVVGHPSYAMLMGANIDVTVHVNGTDYPVVGIEAGAFDGCTELLSFDCHFTLTELGDHTFRGCTSLFSVGLYNTDTPPTLGEGVFEGLGLDTLWLMVPFCSQYDYSQHEVFGQFGTIMGNGYCEYNFFNADGDNQWDNPANWQDASFETCTEAPGAGARVAIFEDCEIGADVTVGSITIGNYYEEEYDLYERLTVKDGATLTATDFIYTTGDARNFIIEDGAQVIHPNAGAQATVEKNITAYTPNSKNGWHLVSSPAIESFAPTADNGFLANDYDLYFYDEPAHYWRNYKPNGQYAGFSIEPLKGYLYANSANDTLQLQGTLRTATETVNFPLSYTDGIALAGFNLVGNPFAHNVTDFTGTNVAEEVYQLNDLRNEVVVGSISETNPLQPGEGFFVKATGGNASITFNSRATNAERSLSQSKGCINLELRENGLVVDRFILKRDGAPLEKFTLNENGTKVYATKDAQDWAVVVIASEAKQSSPTGQAVNFKAAKDGEYTLSVNVENMDLDYLHLIDNLTGADVDLLPLCKEGQGDSTSATYTFQAKTTDYASRFKLVFSTNDASTGSASDAPFAYISDGNIIVNGKGTLQVIDMMGRVIVSHNGHTRCVSTAGMPAGVYVLRLIDGENVRTQKIVVE